MKNVKTYLRCVVANKWLFHSIIAFLAGFTFISALLATHSKEEFVSNNFLWFGIILSGITMVICFAIMMLTMFGAETYENYLSVYEYLQQGHELKDDYLRCVSKTYCENIGVKLAQKDYQKNLHLSA